MSAASSPDALLRGFDDPVGDGGDAFRALMDAMAHPGKVVPVNGPVEHPAPLSDAASAVLLALCDYLTPIWLAEGLRTAAVEQYLRFHTAAPFTDDPARAAFAAVDGSGPAALNRFSPGTPDYPDRAATVIVEVSEFDGGTPVRLSGPGIESRTDSAPQGLAPGFWREMQSNNAGFPLGVDVVLTAPGRIAALPRSTTIEVP